MLEIVSAAATVAYAKKPLSSGRRSLLTEIRLSVGCVLHDGDVEAPNLLSFMP